MGPVLIFDKSFLQSISIDESVWLEQFFLNNITPLFYTETLADLSLTKAADGRNPEIIIKELAFKTPTNGSFPNMYHQRLVVGNLLGQEVEMNGRPLIEGGVPKQTYEGKIGYHFSEPPEVHAMNRWHKGEFNEIEKEFAKEWRRSLSNVNHDQILAIVKNMVPSNIKLSNLKDIKSYVDKFIQQSDEAILRIALDFLDIPSKFRQQIINRWLKENRPSLSKFAPYAIYVFKIDLFFCICMLKGFESKERHSHKIDLAYLYYLPFCHVFTSKDKIHKRIAQLFMENGQIFVPGDELKTDLKKIDAYFDKLPEEIKAKGVMGMATYPPNDIDTTLAKLWDKYCPFWRKHLAERDKTGFNPKNSDKNLIEHLNKVEKESISINPIKPITTDEASYVIFSRHVPVRKGKWRMISKEVEEMSENIK